MHASETVTCRSKRTDRAARRSRFGVSNSVAPYGPTRWRLRLSSRTTTTLVGELITGPAGGERRGATEAAGTAGAGSSCAVTGARSDGGVERGQQGLGGRAADDPRLHLVHHVGEADVAADVVDDDRAAPAAPEADLLIGHVGQRRRFGQAVADAEAQRDPEHEVD